MLPIGASTIILLLIVALFLVLARKEYGQQGPSSSTEQGYYYTPHAAPFAFSGLLWVVLLVALSLAEKLLFTRIF